METLINAPADNRQLVIALIREDLTNFKLINSLNDLGIDASSYSLNICVIIFRLMGLQDSVQNEPLMEHYYDLAGRSKFLKHPTHFDDLTLEIYEYLCTVSPQSAELSK